MVVETEPKSSEDEQELMAQRAAWLAMESGERSAENGVVSPLSVTAVEESLFFFFFSEWSSP